MKCSLCFLALLVCAAPVHAQESVVAVWHRLQAASSVEDITYTAAGGTDADITNALVRQRRYELTGRRSDAAQARQDLERLTEKGSSAAAHFALGVALARGPDVRFVVGDDPALYVVSRYSNAAQQAPRALKRALELDPSLHEAAYVLAEFALDVGIPQLLGDALALLEDPAREESARRYELRSRILAHLGEFVGAADAADQVNARGGDPSLAAYLKGVALLGRTSTREAGATAYLAGAAAMTEESAVAYYDAVAALLAPHERERWRESDLRARGEWLARYWDVQAALSGVTVAQRLAEHYSRLAEIRRRGRSAFMGAAVGRGAGRVVSDTRAIGIPDFQKLLVLRHGDRFRDLRVRYCGREVLELPRALAPTWQECIQSPRSRMWEANADFVRAWGLIQIQAAEAAAAGTSYDRPFATYLSVLHELLQFRGAGGMTTIVAAAAVPTSSASELVRDGLLAASVQLALVDTARMTVVRQDTLRTFRVERLPETGWVLLPSELSVTPQSAQLYRVAIIDITGKIGRIVGGDVDIRSYASTDLMLSDVLITPEDGTPSFARGDVRLSLAPGREYRANEAFTLYYEVYGLTAGDAYRTEIIVEPRPTSVPGRARALVKGTREAIRLSFEETATASHAIYGVQQKRSVGLDGIQEGTYTVRVLVTDARGRTVSRERLLFVGDTADRR